MDAITKKFQSLNRRISCEILDIPCPEDQSVSEKLAELTVDVKKMQKDLGKDVKGQEQAIRVFCSGYFDAQMRRIIGEKHKGPAASFLFAGPPGMGKTRLAEAIGEHLGRPFKRFDMSEYCDKESTYEFTGSDAVYKNSQEGNFTKFVKDNQNGIVLLDEIEKAHINIIHLFLQILDAGEIRDSKTDKPHSVENMIFIFTTNAGRQLYEESEDIDFSMLPKKVILSALQKDINPATGEPYFPAAICSRFAAGNVVMFNALRAHHLVDLVKSSITKKTRVLQEQSGIQIQVKEDVYPAILLAQGGSCDGRVAAGSAENFISEQIFELFRLVDSNKVRTGIPDLKKIKIQVDLPKKNKDITSLFQYKQARPEVLVVAEPEVVENCDSACQNECEKYYTACSVEEAVEKIKKEKISIVLLDLLTGAGDKQDFKFMNIEDENTVGRDIFWKIRTDYPDLPIYALQKESVRVYSPEEVESFLRMGVRGLLEVEDKENLRKQLSTVVQNSHYQNSIRRISTRNQVLAFETSQTLTPDGTSATINLFDFELETAVEAEDAENILSNISRPDVHFADVIGAEEAQKELQYFADYLKDPYKYIGTNVRAPKGVILYGPPGTGKTMLAKAMACEADVTFISEEGNKFVCGRVGEGAERIHKLFRIARKYAPSILFIDEIDAFAKQRTGEDRQGTEATLTALLAEMDGFATDSKRPVFVMAATNYEVNPGTQKSLDPALMRRFDRRILVDLPSKDERMMFLKEWNQKKNSNSDSLKLEGIAQISAGMSLAELGSVLELSLRNLIRSTKETVDLDMLEEAFESFNGGKKKQVTEAELERIAYHEAGHALVGYLCGRKPAYITIVPRADYGGYTMSESSGNLSLTRENLLDRICSSLGGRAAEIVKYGDKTGINTGAASDLKTATRIAKEMICNLGMDDDFGLVFMDSDCSQVNERIKEILAEQNKRVTELISENKAKLEKLAEALLDKTHLTGEEIEKILSDN